MLSSFTNARRTGALAGLMLSICLPAIALAGKADATKKSLEELHSRIESLNKELESTREAHSDAADSLKKSELAISEINRKLYQIKRQQKSSNATLSSLQQEKGRLEATIRQQQELLGRQLYQQYLHGQQSHLQIILSRQDPNTVARDLRYYSYISRARAQRIASLRSNLAQVAALNEKTSATLKEIEELESEQESQRQQLEAEKKEHKTLLTSLAQQLKAQRSEISRLKRDEKRLTNLVKRLARIVPTKPKRAKPESLATNSALPTPKQAAGSFRALKGKLHLPVIGKIANRFGTPREDGGVSWKGLFIRAGEGTTIKSIASGTVVFADWLRGFGNLIIIDHGDDYMSLYGNNQALLKQVGEEVRAGDDIAAVGNSGGNPEYGVYFELRHRSNPFDPLAWCDVK